MKKNKLNDMRDKAKRQISLLVLEEGLTAAQEIGHEVIQNLEKARWRPVI